MHKKTPAYHGTDALKNTIDRAMFYKYRAIIFDIDGTLVRHHPLAVPTSRVQAAVQRAQEAGILVSVATGRLVNGFERINKHLHLTVPVVLEGGARLYDPVARRDIWTGYFAEEEARAIVHDWHTRGLSFGFSAGGKVYNSASMIEIKKKDPARMHANQLVDRIELTEEVLDTINYGMVTHLISFPLTPTAAETLRESMHAYTRIDVSVNTTHYNEGWCVYVTHAKATKQHGILEFARYCSISPREIIGVGDQEMDYPLLMACGLKIAMGNAVQSLKDIADYVAPSVDEDGAAEVIEKFLLSPLSSI